MPDAPEPARWERVKGLFRAAVTLEGAERAAFLSSACGHDATLRRELDALLAAAPDTAATAEPFVVDATVADPLIGHRVGPYRVLAEIGRGGMGAVYCAVRDDDAFMKSVALKVMKADLATEYRREAFRRERQILATLQHPNVAQLLDGGTTDDGRPYLVMELVLGDPIDVYCERHGLDVRRRLELFRSVCAAVHGAHQSLVVHRDIKPGNILVTDEGVPKLLDFGIAKLLPREAADSTVTEVRAMTPLYASPEQLLGQPITTASDVYSLGVVLYELLTGRRPLELRDTEPAEVIRRISEEEPPRPSAAARDTFAKGSAAATFPAGPRNVARELRGDLDSIVMMALRKEPSRRYRSVLELDEDLARYLSRRPVRARPDTVLYRARRFVSRHRAGVAAAVLVVASLLGGLATTTAQRRRADAERVRAERQARRAMEVTRFLRDTLGAAHPETGIGREATVLEALEAARKTSGEAFAGSPDIQAAVRTTIGGTYAALGRYDEADALLRSALEQQRSLLGDESLEAAETRVALGELLRAKGELAEADDQLRRALAVRERLLGPDHPDVAAALNGLGALCWSKGDLGASAAHVQRAVAIMERQPERDERQIGVMLGNLAPALEPTDPAEAERVYRRALDIWRRLGLERSQGYSSAAANLGLLLRDQGKHAAAEPLLREALALDRVLVGPRHPDVATSLNNLAGLLRDRGDYAAARPMFVEAVGILEGALGPDHWSVGRLRDNLGVCLMLAGDGDGAERELVAAEAVLAKAVGPADERTQRATSNLATLYDRQKRPEDAARVRARLASAAAAPPPVAP
ncbi:MAG TPA: serine/threonine-protein kinase [Vicinamibacteria bacterium]|jgi:serine/threonine-protein kinase